MDGVGQIAGHKPSSATGSGINRAVGQKNPRPDRWRGSVVSSQQSRQGCKFDEHVNHFSFRHFSPTQALLHRRQPLYRLRLEYTDNSLTICAAKPWSETSEAELCPADRARSSFRLPYFLEVAVAKDVLCAWSFARNGCAPNISEKCEAIIYYAENDSFLLPKHENH